MYIEHITHSQDIIFFKMKYPFTKDFQYHLRILWDSSSDKRDNPFTKIPWDPNNNSAHYFKGPTSGCLVPYCCI